MAALAVGATAPAFELKTLDGKNFLQAMNWRAGRRFGIF